MKKIAILAPIGLKIPPKKRGGIERIVYYLAEGLVKRKWPVLIFGPRTTKTSANLIEVCPFPLSYLKPKKEVEWSRKVRIEMSILAKIFSLVFKNRKEIFLIFNHSIDGGFFSPLEKILKIPVFHVLHLPILKEEAEVYKNFNSRLITVSKSQRKKFPKLNYQKTIYNGIPLDFFPFSKKAEDFFLFVGKISPHKNPYSAISAAKMTNSKLILVGKIDDEKYFKEKIKPNLKGKIEYLGELNQKRLISLYKKAKALLMPIEWEEPFGLVMIEAMACGTPVIAFKRGSVEEVIKDGKTGFIVKDEKEMAEKMEKIGKIKREDCREWVKKNFSVEKMIDDYEEICKEFKK